MSDRSLSLPDRALASLLSSLSKRLTMLERRIRWPGATRFAEEPDDTDIVVTDIAVLSPSFTELCTVDIDRGRYLVLAGVEVLSAAPGGGSFRLRAQVTFNDVSIAGALDGGATAGAAVVYSSLTPVATISFDAPGTLVLEAQYAVTSAAGDASSSFAYLIALPA